MSPDASTGILCMAYGSPATEADIAGYFTHIRGGRPPSPEALQELTQRYRAIDASPLTEITRAQATALSARTGLPAFVGMKHAAPYMKKQGSGSIINNGSIAGNLAGFSSSVVYGAAKAAVIHLTKCVAMELGESNIRVNSISPGAIATGIFGKALGLPTEAAEKTPAVMREVYKAAHPIPRAGLPDDIAHAAVFLASDESSFVNGHDLVVDGAITGGRNWTQQQQGYVALRKAFDQGA